MHESAGSLLTDEKFENFNLIIGKIQLKSSKETQFETWYFWTSVLRDFKAKKDGRLASAKTHSWLIRLRLRTAKTERGLVRNSDVLALEAFPVVFFEGQISHAG